MERFIEEQGKPKSHDLQNRCNETTIGTKMNNVDRNEDKSRFIHLKNHKLFVFGRRSLASVFRTIKKGFFKEIFKNSPWIDRRINSRAQIFGKTDQSIPWITNMINLGVNHRLGSIIPSMIDRSINPNVFGLLPSSLL